MTPVNRGATDAVVSSAAVRRGDASAVARALTLLASNDPAAASLLDDLTETASSAAVGVFGPPGVGKSSLLRELARELRASGERVGIVAVDPVSESSGGAFLGDRLRFADLASDRGLFLRSWGHRAPPGATPAHLMDAARVFGAAGYDWTFFESVGVGQTEVNVFREADTRVLVLAPSTGDGYQMLKAGYMEAADIYVAHQGDRPEASAWADELRRSLTRDDGGSPTVVETSALTRDGIAELVVELRRRRR